jgi:hypothetical protein
MYRSDNSNATEPSPTMRAFYDDFKEEFWKKPGKYKKFFN